MRITRRTLSSQSQTARQAPLNVNVIYTGLSATRAALGAAAYFATDLGARIRLIVLRPIPDLLPLDHPPVSMRFDRERMLAFVDENTTDASLLMCYCRDEVNAVRYLLESNGHFLRSSSIIVIGGKKRRWFPTKAQRIAGKLEKAGHQVVFVDSGEGF